MKITKSFTKFFTTLLSPSLENSMQVKSYQIQLTSNGDPLNDIVKSWILSFTRDQKWIKTGQKWKEFKFHDVEVWKA